MDNDFNLKLSDFGFAGPTAGSQGFGKFVTHIGTETYMSPEQHREKPYVGQRVDLFAAGVVLFTLLSGHFPFKSAIQKDGNYRCIAYNRSESFWETIEEGCDTQFSKEFKHFFNCLV